jgi:hypothetical protein
MLEEGSLGAAIQVLSSASRIRRKVVWLRLISRAVRMLYQAKAAADIVDSTMAIGLRTDFSTA